MAAPDPTDKIRDKEYSNWLKVTLALYYMKSGLHAFIQSEVDCLHQSLVQKIYGGSTVPLPPCTMCHASHVKRNKFTDIWAFQKQCRSCCDVWIYELLRLHTNPKSKKIYWDNSDVPSWPFKSWECAKVFMPRGQLPSNAGPVECDAQALLTLLSNCTHFQSKLSPQGLGLTHTISTIRNKVMHNGDMIVSDADRMSFIQQIIQLLEDPVSLMSLEDCKAAVSNIHQIHNDSIDVIFNMDLQMIALKTAVNEVRQELGMQEKRTLNTVESLKEEYRQLREQLTTKLKDVETRVDTIERDVQLVKEQTDISLQKQEKKHQEMHATVTSQLTKRYEDVENRVDMVVQDVQSVKEQTDTALHQQESLSESMKTMSACVTTYGLRLGTVEENVQSFGTKLQEFEIVKEQTDTALQQQKTFSESMETMSTSVAIHGVRLDTVEENVQSFGTKLQEFETVKEQTDTALQQQKTFSESMETMSTSVAIHGVRLDTVEEIVQSFDTKLQEFETVKEQTDTALQQQKTFSESMETMSAGVATHGVRLDAVEENFIKLQEIGQRTGENSSCAKETPTKRRPQTDGLKQLKGQTDDKLDTVRRLGFIPTKQMEEAKKLLQDTRSIVIQGNPGEGKTTTALLLIDDELFIDRRVLIRCPRDWKTVDTDWVDIVVLEDIFGRFDLDPRFLQEWLVYLPSIQDHVDARKLQVIITTRVDILAKAYTNLKSINLFCDEFSLTLSSDKLQDSEKIKILNKELQRHKRNMQDDDKKECIANFKGLIGFPQCCSFFAGDNGLFAKGPDFFKQPEKLFSVNMRELEKSRFLSLAFLFCTGSIPEKYLSPEAMTELGKSLLIELSSHLGISKKKAAVTLLRESYDNFCGLYVRKCNSCISFSHNTVWEAVGLVLGERSPEMVVKYCDSEYLNQRTYAAESKDRTSHNVFIPVSAYQHMAERIILDALHGILESTRLDKHSAIKQHQFVIELKDQLRKCDRINDFLCSKTYMHLPNVLEGECRTFLQLLLQSDGNTAKVVYDQFLEFLICSHDNYGFDTECRKCSEKKCLLELALYYNHLDIADKLTTMNACLSPISLCNAVKHGSLYRVKTILDTLKRDGSLDPHNIYVRKSLCRAFMSGNMSLVELLLKEGIELDRSHVICVVKQGDIDALVKLVEYLKHGNDWNPLHEKGSPEDRWEQAKWISGICPSLEEELQFSIALYFAYREGKLDMAEFLLKEGVKVTMGMFLAVLQHESYVAATNVLQDLKDTDQWNPESDCVSKAGKTAYITHKCDLFALLIQKDVSFTMKNLPDVVSWGSNESITKVLQHLKISFKWDPKSDYASQALINALNKGMSDVCVLLVKEGIPLTVDIINGCWGTIESLTKVIEHLRERNKWNPKADIASETLKLSYIREKNDVSKQLLQEGVTLTMSNLPGILRVGSKDSVTKAIHHLKDTGKWDVRVNCLNETVITLLQQQKYDVCDILIQQGVLLDMYHLSYVVNCGSSDFVPKAIQHLRVTGRWDPKCDAASEALNTVYMTQKYDVCDLLIHEGVSLSFWNILYIINGSGQSVESVERAIWHLKNSNNWYPKSEYICTELEQAYRYEKYSLCDLLIQEGVSLSMKNLLGLINKKKGLTSVESVTKAIQHLKNTNIWDSDSCHAFEALQTACVNHMYNVSNLLFREGVSFTMKNLLDVVLGTSTTAKQQLKEAEFITQIIKHLKDTAIWDPSSAFVTQALEKAYSFQKDAVFDLLLQEKISPTMKILPDAVDRESNEFVTALVQLMKTTNTWDPSSYLASDALQLAFRQQNYYICNLLIHEKVLLTMKNLPDVVRCGFIEPITKAIQLLKDANLWDPSSDYASVALGIVYNEINTDGKQNYDVSDMLIQEGVSFKMKDLGRYVGSYHFYTKVIHHLKDKGNWDPYCESASLVLLCAYDYQMYDVCDLLIQEGISLTMEDLLHLGNFSLKFVSKVVHHLKDKGNWDPHSESASVALKHAYDRELYEVCDLLIQEGVSPTMENLLLVINVSWPSLKSVSKVVQHLKDKCNWDPHCESASVALKQTFRKKEYDICNLLIQEGILLTMEYLLLVINDVSRSPFSVSKAVQFLKAKGYWNPHCESASAALQHAYREEDYDVCDLLIQEGILPTMENLLPVINGCWPSLHSVSKVVQHLKDKGNWDPHCKSASVALQQAYGSMRDDVCDLLIQEGILPTMEYLLFVINVCWPTSQHSVSEVVYTFKDNGNCNPHCENASVALQQVYRKEEYDHCDLLIQGVLPTEVNQFFIIMDSLLILDSVSKVVHQLKDKGNWNPHCESASVALQQAYVKETYDVCDMLIQEGILPTMENLLFVINITSPSLQSVSKVVQHLKDKGNWNPHCETASVALQQAYVKELYDVCDLLIQERILPTMENLHFVINVSSPSLQSVSKIVQNLKAKGKWNPYCESASVALQQAYRCAMHDVCNLLIEEGILPTFGSQNQSMHLKF